MFELFKVVTDGCGNLIALMGEHEEEIARVEIDAQDVEEYGENRATENAMFDLVKAVLLHSNTEGL